MNDYYKESREFKRRMQSIERKSKIEQILLYVMIALVIAMFVILVMMIME
jgi:cell division septal protein FtsQ